VSAPLESFQPFSLFTDFDIHLFKAGKHFRLFEKLGAHLIQVNGKPGVYFSVWAPGASKVSVIGNFNFWSPKSHGMQPRWDESGIWETFVEGIEKGEAYKFGIVSGSGEYLEKADPFAVYYETPPKTASIVWDREYQWNDSDWLTKRKQEANKPKPYSVYEVHLGSWRRNPLEDNRSLSYRELIDEMVPYVKDNGFTHVEFMPIMEHPFGGSWGYQVTGYFAPTSRFGEPQDFMALIDAFHQAGVGVILDWVPSHFPGDAHGLFKFDGNHLFEHADPRQGFHPDWSSFIYNYNRNEVRAFLISNAIFWLDRFHADGLRVDAVASMLYLDYSRKAGEWIPNRHGGNENLEAISFLKEFNETVYANFPDATTIAEESTAWPGISKPTFMGGIGFGQKWMMGWMHDTLQYFQRDSIHRKYHQNDITFSMMYAFTENFMLPLSHDEVVHGKRSLIGRMPGDEWRMFANLRTLYSYMFTHPGSKLLFMGCEFAQYEEWNHDGSLHWHLLDRDFNKGMLTLIHDLNHLYKSERGLYHFNFDYEGFEWIDYSDREHSVMAFQRKSDKPDETLVVVCNFTPESKDHYRLGVPSGGEWKEIFNSNDLKYAGSGVVNGSVQSDESPSHGKPNSISFILSPLAVMVFRLNRIVG
jgi:1,4-alpha-glucan branching enzyme